MKRLLFSIVMNFAGLMLAILDAFLWVPSGMVRLFEWLRDWAIVNLETP